MKTVKIGNQEWMAENLNVSTFRNGDPIPEVKSDEDWEKAGDFGKPACCYYGNDQANGDKYGRLYNWYAVADPRGLAPRGWHVASDTEWETLVEYLGGGDVAGWKIKEMGTAHWNSPNTAATNESGISALPGGCRYDYGPFDALGSNALFWSSTEYYSGATWYRFLSIIYSRIIRGSGGKEDGLSVRCVKDLVTFKSLGKFKIG